MTDRKVFYFDVETTGLDCTKHSIVQLAYIVEKNFNVFEAGNLLIRPFAHDPIDSEALAIHKRTKEEVLSYPEPAVVYRDLCEIFNKYIDKYDKNDKFYPAGFNVGFDLDFLSAFFKAMGDNYLGSFLNWKRLDPLPFLYNMDFSGELELPNYKLETVCKHYGIDLIAHDALSDIRATRKLIHSLLGSKEVPF